MIGIVLKKTHPTITLVMSDVNPRAVELAKVNCEKNEIEATVIESDGYEAIEGEFDTVISNPPIRTGKKVIYRLFDDSYYQLKEGGELIIVIRKQQGAESAKAHIEEVFGSCEILAKNKGYWVLCAQKIH